jgi:toxin CcdB
MGAVLMGAVRISELGPCVGNLQPEDTAIVAALDMLTGA